MSLMKAEVLCLRDPSGTITAGLPCSKHLALMLSSWNLPHISPIKAAKVTHSRSPKVSIRSISQHAVWKTVLNVRLDLPHGVSKAAQPEHLQH